MSAAPSRPSPAVNGLERESPRERGNPPFGGICLHAKAHPNNAPPVCLNRLIAHLLTGFHRGGARHSCFIFLRLPDRAPPAPRVGTGHARRLPPTALPKGKPPAQRGPFTCEDISKYCSPCTVTVDGRLCEVRRGGVRVRGAE